MAVWLYGCMVCGGPSGQAGASYTTRGPGTRCMGTSRRAVLHRSTPEGPAGDGPAAAARLITTSHNISTHPELGPLAHRPHARHQLQSIPIEEWVKVLV